VGGYAFNCCSCRFRAAYLMVMGRAQMRQQVSKPPQKRKWSAKRKKAINCKKPRGFSERAHCAGKRKKRRG